MINDAARTIRNHPALLQNLEAQIGVFAATGSAIYSIKLAKSLKEMLFDQQACSCQRTVIARLVRSGEGAWKISIDIFAEALIVDHCTTMLDRIGLGVK